MPKYGKTDIERVRRELNDIRNNLEIKAAPAGAEPIRTQPTPTIMAAKGYVMPLRANVTQLRYWADTNEWIRAAIDHRCNQVGHTDWGIVPIEPGDPFDPELKARILTALVFPNTRKDSFRSLMALVTQDLMVLDAGVLEKQLTYGGEPCGAVAVDGGAIRIFPEWDGSDPNAPHYAWMPMNIWRASFTNDQMIYIMARPSTHRLYGLSPLEILKETIEAEINAAVYNKRQVQQASPSGIINLGENIGREQVASFRAFWDSEIAGRRGTAFMGGAKNPEFIRWDQNNREMQYMQWQVYLIRKICHSADTETLTDKGWRHYWEIEPDERVATYNPDSGQMEFRVPRERMVFDYTGQMVHFENEQVDVLVTPEHRMLYRTGEKWCVRPAGELAEMYEFKIKQGAPITSAEPQQITIPAVPYAASALSHYPDLRDLPLTFDDVALARFVGYFVSEGSLHSGGNGQYRLGMSQTGEPVRDQMRQAFAALGLGYRVHENGTSLTVSHKSLWYWLQENCGKYSGERRVPLQIKSLRIEALQAFLDAALVGDGSVRKNKDGTTNWRYFTTSPGLADDVQEVATRCGYRATIRKLHEGTYYCVSISTRTESWVRRVDVSRPDYRGKVYCFDTPPNHLFFTRRNGKVAVTGNCSVFGMNAQDLGMTLEMNRATSEVAADISEDSGLRPLLSLIEEYINREFVADFQQVQARKFYDRGDWDMGTYRRAQALISLNPRIEEHVEAYKTIRSTTKALEEAAFLNVMFRYNLPSGRSLAAEADYATKALGGLPWHTVDEIRKRQNLDPTPGGSEIIVMTPVGALPLAMLVGSALPATDAQAKMIQKLLESPALRLSASDL
jgi:hypothetical protein